MVDPRNDPKGYSAPEKPQRYLIRKLLSTSPELPSTPRYQIRGTTDPTYELGDVEEHVTRVTTLSGRFFHAVAYEDQLYADLCTRLIQRACEYFYEKAWTPMLGAPDIRLTDDQVRESISNLDLGENTREAVRTNKPRYILTDLPWGQQRALIEQLYALRARWGFQKLGE